MIALLLGAQAFVRPPMVGVMAPAVAPKSPAPQMGPDALQALGSRIELLQFQMQAQWFMIPIGYFVATRWMDNVDMRYDRILGYGDDDRGMFGGRFGRRGRRDYGRDYDRGYGYSSYSEPYDRYGYEPFDRGFRSAPEIFSAGLDNFIRDPTGWLSPRYGGSDRYYPDRSTYNRYSSSYPNRISAGRYFADRNSDRSFNSRSRYSSGRYLRGGRGSRYDDYEYGGRIIPTDAVSAMGESARERRDRWLNGPPPV